MFTYLVTYSFQMQRFICFFKKTYKPEMLDSQFRFTSLIQFYKFTNGNLIGIGKYNTSIGILQFHKTSLVAQWYGDISSKQKVAGSTPGADQNFGNFFFKFFFSSNQILYRHLICFSAYETEIKTIL